MLTETLFRSLNNEFGQIEIQFEGQPLSVPTGMSLAAALLASGVHHTRESAINGRPGAPYCMMGVCFECVVEIDGQANCQACLTGVRPGMSVRVQSGARDLLPWCDNDE
ncbi:MAG TPA: (2Fe-2S)-binding protein [Pseudomonas sp.]|jgi:predicted molibdopterin-dependent oxidoreductase YjgC